MVCLIRNTVYQITRIREEDVYQVENVELFQGALGGRALSGELFYKKMHKHRIWAQEKPIWRVMNFLQ